MSWLGQVRTSLYTVLTCFDCLQQRNAKDTCLRHFSKFACLVKAGKRFPKMDCDIFYGNLQTAESRTPYNHTDTQTQRGIDNCPVGPLSLAQWPKRIQQQQPQRVIHGLCQETSEYWVSMDHYGSLGSQINHKIHKYVMGVFMVSLSGNQTCE